MNQGPSIHDLNDMNLKDHIIIVGFGLNGKNVARAARIAHIPYVVIEMNPETVRGERAKGEPIYYGDATSEVVFERAKIEKARVIIIVISDPGALRKACVLARRLESKHLHYLPHPLCEGNETSVRYGRRRSHSGRI